MDAGKVQLLDGDPFIPHRVSSCRNKVRCIPLHLFPLVMLTRPLLIIRRGRASITSGNKCKGMHLTLLRQLDTRCGMKGSPSRSWTLHASIAIQLGYGLVLACFWLGPGLVLTLFWLAPGLLLAWFWLGSGLALAWFWLCFSFVLGLFIYFLFLYIFIAILDFL